MKKIITLSMTVFMVAAVFAQTSKDEARRVILGTPKKTSTSHPRDVILGGNNGNTYPNYPTRNYPYGSREAQIDQVNREYDYKIQTIRNNRALSPQEKDRMIRDLNNERNARIQQINNQYDRNYKKYDDDDDHNGNHNKKHGKHDNGKHLGWYKGKGNPHNHDD